MKKILTALLFLLINFTCFSQTKQEFEYELSYYNSNDEWGNKKDIAYKLIEMDSVNIEAIYYLSWFHYELFIKEFKTAL
jgi:hypothetical protein